jgi:hypothetical protein
MKEQEAVNKLRELAKGIQEVDNLIGVNSFDAEAIITVLDALDNAAATAKDYNYKLEYLAQTLYTKDGVFSFPDGDYVKTKVAS